MLYPLNRRPRAAGDRENWNVGERRRQDTNHESIRMLSMVAFWGGHKNYCTVRYMLYPPACISPDLPTKNWRSAGPARSWCLLSKTGLVARGCGGLVCLWYNESPHETCKLKTEQNKKNQSQLSISSKRKSFFFDYLLELRGAPTFNIFYIQRRH